LKLLRFFVEDFFKKKTFSEDMYPAAPEHIPRFFIKKNSDIARSEFFSS